MSIKQSKNIGLFVSEVISFNQDTETRQVKYDNEDVGTILIDRATTKKIFRTRAVMIDDFFRIAEWVNKESFASSVKVKEVRRQPIPLYYLYLKTTAPDTDMRVRKLAQLIYKNQHIEDLSL